ncbi:MAG: shikimate dehydrogenase, partial [Candidatus Heimdallarchaeota archaeon]|nr:shikimate dehydrogenase [Candidatus Heimdallarchaeota archaeon]
MNDYSNNREFHPTAMTQVLGIIGYPVDHAMSPLMHNTAFRDLKLDYIYVGFSVTPSNLGHAIQGIKALNIAGLSITIPHKIAIMQYLDEIDPLSKQIGAVNTIKNVKGKLYGRNTDGEGCLKGLKDAGIKLQGKNATLLGAGGAACAVGMCLAREVDTLTIVNRTSSRLQDLK